MKQFSIIAITLLLISSMVFAQDADTDSIKVKVITPKGAMYRSLAMPGWGQLYVKKPLKAGIYFAAEAWHIYNAYEYNEDYKWLKKTRDIVGYDIWDSMNSSAKQDSINFYTGHDVQEPHHTLRRRNLYCWWSVGFYLIAMLDCYVEAHLLNFPKGKIEYSYYHTKQETKFSLYYKFGK